MRRRVIKLVTIMVLLALLIPSYVAARLLFYTPVEMITKSSLIVMATVTGRTLQGSVLAGEFKIERVLIGDYDGTTLRILQRTDRFPEITQDIPERGTEVFLLLSKDSTGQYGFTHLNSVGIVHYGRVASIYKGINDSKQPYVTVYNCFIEGMNRMESESQHKSTGTTVLSIKEKPTKKPKDFKLIYMEVFIPAVTLILVLYLWREKSQADQQN